jgi:hypothetical protein
MIPMADRIECITKPGRYSHHEAIEYVGGVRANGERFYITRQECAADILDHKAAYEVVVGNVRTVVEAYEVSGRKYIRTKRDRTNVDNLLSLREC